MSGAAAQEPEREWTPEQRAVIEAASAGPVGIESDFERWERGFHRDWTYWRLGTGAHAGGRDRA